MTAAAARSMPGAGAVFGAVIGDPGAWLLGVAGFLVRGGIFVLLLPILTVPSPVGIALFIGPGIINTGRLSGPALVAACVAVAVAMLLLTGALLVAAWLEQRAFERMSGDPEVAALAGADGGSAARPGRLGRLVAVQVAALVPVVLAALAAAGPLAASVRHEILLPDDLAVPLVLRAARGAVEPLLVLVASIVLADLISGLLSRRVLQPRRGRPASPRAIVRGALRVIATATVGWLVAAVIMLPAIAAVIVTWGTVRDAWLSGAPFHSGPAAAVAAETTLIFVAVWLAALLLGGLVSTLRGALWTARALPPGRDWTAGGN
jgi:hypothetical protein